MANINLGNYYRKKSDKVSPVDSKIVLDKSETDKKYYGDIKLDLAFNDIKDRALNAKISDKDSTIYFPYKF